MKKSRSSSSRISKSLFRQQEIFSIRKLSLGVASVLLGSFFIGGNVVQAEEISVGAESSLVVGAEEKPPVASTEIVPASEGDSVVISDEHQVEDSIASQAVPATAALPPQDNSAEEVGVGSENVASVPAETLPSTSSSSVAPESDPQPRSLEKDGDASALSSAVPAATSSSEIVQPVVEGGQVLPRSAESVGGDESSSEGGVSGLGTIQGGRLVIPEGVTEIDDNAYANNRDIREVVFPSTLTKIGSGAFSGTSLTTISLPASVTIIESYAFSGTQLTDVSLPVGLTHLGDYAFGNISSLTSINIPKDINSDRNYYTYNSPFSGSYNLAQISFDEGITVIPDYLFKDLSGLTELSLPSTVTTIGNEAFLGTGLREVIIPAGVTRIGYDAFNIDSLTKVTFPSSLESAYSAFFGSQNLKEVVLTGNWTKIPSGLFKHTGIERLVIPEGVTEIESNAFSGSSLREVVFPSTLTKIGSGAFSGTPLTTISLPSSVTTIESSAFSGTQLTDVSLPAGLTHLGNYAFGNISSLTSINIPKDINSDKNYDVYFSPFAGSYRLNQISFDEGITAIPDNLFKGLSGLTEVSLPSTVTTIGNRAFSGTSLTTISLPASVTTIGSYAFSDTQLTIVNLPSGLTHLGDYAFGNIGSLTSINIPKYINSDHNYYSSNSPFSGSSNLNQISFDEGITVIPNYLFKGLSSLTEVSLPSTITRIGNESFSGTGLREVVIPDGVTYIGYNAFDIDNLTKVTLPLSLESASSTSSAFAGSPNLKEVVLTGNWTKIPSGLFTGTGIERLVIPEGVTEIESNAFSDTSLREVVFPSTLTKIGSGAFSGTLLTTISLPASVTAIESYAFSGTQLTDVSLPAGLTHLGDYAFGNISSLTSINIPKDITSGRNYYSHNSPFSGSFNLTQIRFDEGITVIPDYLFKGLSSLTEVSLPSTVTRIGNESFSGTGLIEVIIPEGVTEIDDNAFSGTSLREVVFPSTLTKIGSGAFSGTPLTTISLPASVTTIESSAFSGTQLTDVSLPAGLTRLGDYAFGNISNLTSINIPKNINSDPNYYANNSPFSGSSNLTQISFDEGITVIPNYLFQGLSSLVGILIPEGVTAIGDSAFAYTNIADITLPTSLERIGSSAFSNTKLSSVIVPDNVKTIGLYAFGNTPLELVVLPREMTDLDRWAFARTKLSILEIPEGITSIDDSLYMDNEHLKRVYLPKSLASFSRQQDWLITDEEPEEKIEYYVYIDSYALEYMIENQVPFKLRDENVSSDESKLLDAGNSFYLTTSSSSRREGYLGLDLKYSLKDGKASDDGTYKLRLNIPTTTSLYNGTVRLDGQDIPVTLENGYINLPVTAREGSLKLTLKANNNDLTNVQLFAQLAYEKDGRKTAETIGAVNVVVPVLQVTANAVTSRPYARITGIADPADSLVAYLDGVVVGAIKVKKDGTYQLDVPFTTLENNKEYLIRVEATSPDGQGLTASTTVRYEEGLPELEKFILSYAGNSYDLLDKDVRHLLVWEPWYVYTFDISYSGDTNIKHAFLIVDSSLGRKEYRLTKNSENGSYSYSGLIDYSTRGVTIPTKFKVNYILDREIPRTFENSNKREQLIRASNNFNIQVSKEEKGTIDISVSNKNDINDGFTVGLKTWTDQAFNFEEFRTQIKRMGYDTKDINVVVNSRNSLKSTATGIYSNVMETSIKILAGSSERELARTIINVSAKDTLINDIVRSPSTYKAIEDVSGAFDKLNKIKDYYDYLQVLTDRRQILSQYEGGPYNPNIDPHEALARKTRYAMSSLAYGAIKTLEFGPISLSGLFDLGVGILNIPKNLVTIFGGDTSNWWQAYTLDELNEATYLDYLNYIKTDSQSEAGNFRMIIDPSGIITNADSNLPVRGATTTVYYRGENGEEVLWDAGEYSQLNPLLTTINGEYAWDVPEGYWKVKVEKEGYESAESEWLPVPPPQTEVHFKLKPHAYTIAYNAGEGSMPTTGLVTTYKTDVAVALPQPTRKGYKFAGWFEDSSLTGVTYLDTLFLKPGDKTLFAKWERATKLLGTEAEDAFIHLQGDDVDKVARLVKAEQAVSTLAVDLPEGVQESDVQLLTIQLLDAEGQAVSLTEPARMEIGLETERPPMKVLTYNNQDNRFEEVVFDWNGDLKELQFDLQDTANYLIVYQPLSVITTRTRQEVRVLTTDQVLELEDSELVQGQTREEASINGQVVIEITETLVDGQVTASSERELSRTDAIPRKIYRGSKVVSVTPVITTRTRQEVRVLTTDQVLELEDSELVQGQTREEASINGQVVIEITETLTDGQVTDRSERELSRTDAIPRKIYRGSKVVSVTPVITTRTRQEVHILTTDQVLELEDSELVQGHTREEASINGQVVIEITETLTDGQVTDRSERELSRTEAIPRKVYRGTMVVQVPTVAPTGSNLPTVKLTRVERPIKSVDAIYLEDATLPVGESREEAGQDGLVVVEVAEFILDGQVTETQEFEVSRTEATPRKVYRGTKVVSVTPVITTRTRQEVRVLTTDQVLELEDSELVQGHTREEASINGQVVIEITETLTDGQVTARSELELSRTEATPRKVYRGTMVVQVPAVAPTGSLLPTVKLTRVERPLTSEDIVYLEDATLPVGESREEAGQDGLVVVEVAEFILDSQVTETQEFEVSRTVATPRKIYRGTKVVSVTPVITTRTRQEVRVLTTDQVLELEDSELVQGHTREEASINGQVVIEITETLTDGQVTARSERELSRIEAIPHKIYRGTKVVSVTPVITTRTRQEVRILTTEQVLELEDSELAQGQTREEASINGQVVVEITEILTDGQITSSSEREISRTEAVPRRVYRGTKIIETPLVTQLPTVAPTAVTLPTVKLTRVERPIKSETVVYLEDPTLPVGEIRVEEGLAGLLVVDIAEYILDGQIVKVEEFILSHQEATPRKIYRGRKQERRVVTTEQTQAVHSPLGEEGTVNSQSLPNTGQTDSVYPAILGLSLFLAGTALIKSKKDEGVN
ncbi:TPA: leucine-rich repeat protein [Streptococcus suis]